MPEPRIHVVVMAGGSGTRFWPASRRAHPKQFLRVAGARTLLGETLARVGAVAPPERTWIVTGRLLAERVRAEASHLPAENVLAEPAPRNTLPCVAWAAHVIARRDPAAVQVVVPADHVIEPAEDFEHSVRAAAQHAAEQGGLLTFGIRASHPATGFGWIEPGEELDRVEGLPVLAVRRFVEKPDRARAEEYLARGFLWNSGMFVWSSSAIVEALERHVPEALRALQELDRGLSLEEVYARLPAQPVDVAILERDPGVRVIPVDYRWSDVGSWPSLADVCARGDDGNVSAGGGALVAHDARDCIAHAEPGHLVALLGVEGLVVVQAGRALLVCPKDRAQDVRAIVERLSDEHPEFL